MKKRILQIFLLAAVILFSGCFLPRPCVFADTDGSEIIVVQPEKLEIQLGMDWIGAEFQLRTDQGLYPDLIPVGNDGVLRLEIGGSGSYILSCVSTGRTMPVSRPAAVTFSPASVPAGQCRSAGPRLITRPRRFSLFPLPLRSILPNMSHLLLNR